MKVVFICKDFKASNVRKQPWTHVYHLILEFSKLGISSQIVSYGGNASGSVEEVDRVMVHRVKGSVSINQADCARKLNELKADIVNWHGGIASSYAITRVATGTRSPIVWNIIQRRTSLSEVAQLGIRDVCEPRELAAVYGVYSYSLLPSYFVRAAARVVRAIVVPTSRARASIMQMGVSDRKIAQIASGIDTELFSSKPKCDIDRLRDQIGLGREDFVLCYFGPISTLRGFDTVLEAFSILRNSVANARLLILARQEPLRKSPTDLDELPGVIFVTENLKPSQVVEFLSASDVVVLPFKFWPNNECPLTILEAMASGTAVVTTPIPLVEDVITNGVNGFVVPPRDPNALARLLKALAKDEDKVMTVGANARQYALANCGWSVVADRTLDLFSHLMTLD